MSQYGYPPHQPVPPQPAQKPKMSTGKKIALFGCLPVTIVGVLLAGGCAVFVGGVANEVDKSAKADKAEDKRAAKEDVKITKCSVVDEEFTGRTLKTRVEITNNGDDRANYSVEGEYLDGKGNKVGELVTTVQNLAPGKKSSKDFGGVLISPEDLKGVTGGKCAIVEVLRDEWSAAK